MDFGLTQISPGFLKDNPENTKIYPVFLKDNPENTKISPGFLKDNPENNFTQAYLSIYFSFRRK